MRAQSLLVRESLVLLLLCPALFVVNACGGKGKSSDQSATVVTGDADAQFTATPNPIALTDGGFQGVTTLDWHTTKTQAAEIHVGSPGGQLFCSLGGTGSCQTGKWVTNGMTFYLQNSKAAKPTDPSATLAVMTVQVKN
jgi:hypothetical protein